MSCKISKELANFLNLNYPQNDERISRVKITKLIDSYIETNGLRDYRTIKPDEKLKNLLNCGDNEVTFSNLQSYIAPHIIYNAMVMILSPPPPSAPPLSPECAYAVFPEDELPEPPIPQSPSIYAVFPEDEIIPQVEAKTKAEAQKSKSKAVAEAAVAEAKSKAEAQMSKLTAEAEAKSKAQKAKSEAEAEAKTKAERNCFNCGKPGHSKIDCPYYFST